MKELLNLALSYYGLKEFPGKKHNEVIVNFSKEIGHSWVNTDETAWCSIFINFLAKKCDYESSGKLNARSWLDVGFEPCEKEIGDIVVLWRESKTSWKGHVGLFIRETDKYIYVLGGNQGNAVNIKPYLKSRLLQYRRLNKNK